VLLTPLGVQAAPSAPANLRGVAHTGTMMEPYNSIDLTWENTSLLTRSYELQRSPTGTGNWSTLTLTPPGTATNHTDTTVGVGITYDYRVRAVGIGGNSPWSNVATVTSPATPLDTTRPVVNVLAPSSGATVSGTVTTRAEASDNVGVEYLEISFWNQYSGQQVIPRLGVERRIARGGLEHVGTDAGYVHAARLCVRRDGQLVAGRDPGRRHAAPAAHCASPASP